MGLAIFVLALGAAVALMAWAVRGRSATLLAPGVWRGPRARRVVAITFDDGPSESTARLLELLALHGARATFFCVGHHVRRLPHIAVRALREGHELGNHTETHEALYFRSPAFIDSQIARAQTSIEEMTGMRPRWFRVPYGARWFGLRRALERRRLISVMWTHIARDWALDGAGVAARLKDTIAPGAIYCFHDGRGLCHNPDIAPTLEALEVLLPYWASQGYSFVTLSQLFAAPKR